ncbi:MAG: DNA repair protein RecN [Ruminococcus sp.]|nr:DNA repair protein RecN [Ruminococcus sp.]
MLTELYIENLAVIEKARIPFSGRFNVFTGETGAGKSILIHGINAVLGQRVTKDVVRTGCSKAVVSALFQNISPNVKQVLEELGMEAEDELLLTREIFADGGSSARINHKTATVSAMRRLGELLIDIHGQHDTQILMSSDQHMQMIDRFGGDDSLLLSYQESFRTLQKKAKRLSVLVKQAQEQQQKAEYLKTLVADVERVGLKMGEEDAIASALERLEQSESIVSAIRSAAAALDNENGLNAVTLIREAQDELDRHMELLPEAENVCQRLKTAELEIMDISDTLRALSEEMELDEMKLARLQSRSAAIRELTRSYVCTGDELVQRCAEAKDALRSLQNHTEEIEQLRREKSRLLTEVSDRAKALSSWRLETAERFTASVCEQLQFLDMPGVRLAVSHSVGKLTIQGMDRMELMISANRGESLKPLARIASGGELSRIMLALKCVIADLDSIPTMIFDEIDTGVSGRAAQKIGIKLEELGRVRQVLCVTHLSQIALMADHHLMIEKTVENDRTSTKVMPLDFEGRAREIARIMCGEPPSDLILASARDELRKQHPDLK